MMRRGRLTFRGPGRGARVAALALALGSSLAPCPWARAAGSAAVNEPSEVDKDAARVLVAEADVRFERGDYKGALVLFAEAYQRVPVPTLGLAVAKAQLELGLFVEAKATARGVVDLPRRGREPSVFAEARRAASALGRTASRRVASLDVDVRPASARAVLELDGKAVPIGSPVELNPGRHEVVLHAPGYQRQASELAVTEGEKRRLELRLIAEPSDPGAIAAASPELDVPDPGSGARTRGFVALAVSGLGVAVGATTGVLAFSTKPDCPGDVCNPEAEPEIEASKRYGNVANVGFGVGIVAGVYGLYELLINAPSAARARAAQGGSERAVSSGSKGPSFGFVPARGGAQVTFRGGF